MTEQDKLYENISNAEKLLNQKENINAMIKTIGNLNDYYSATSSILRALDQYKNLSKLNSLNNRAILNQVMVANSVMKVIEQHLNISKLGNINNSLPQFGGAYAILRQAALLNPQYIQTFSGLQRLSIQQSKIIGSIYNNLLAENNIINSQKFSSVQKILDSQERIFSVINKIEYKEGLEDSAEIKIKQLIDTFNSENIEEQIQIINKEPDLNTKISLLNTIVSIIALITMIILGVIAHNDSKEASINQEEIISLLNKNIEIQEQQNELLDKISDNKDQELYINKEQVKSLQELLSTTKTLETKISERD